MSLPGQLGMYLRFAAGLRRFVKTPMSLAQARALLAARLAARETHFLEIAKRGIYESPSSPYLQLLDMVGCRYGDLERIVTHEGLETALTKLAAKGVYLTIEEFKGRTDVVRGSQVLRFGEHDFDNSLISGHLRAASSGSRGTATSTVYDFRFLAANRAVCMALMLDAHGVVANAPIALWAPIMPGWGPATLLGYMKLGRTPARWFCPVSANSFRPSLKNRLGTRYVVSMARAAGKKCPAPEYVPLDDACTVARWLATTIQERGSACLHTNTSMAVRVCQAAKAFGLRIDGAKLFFGGEPLTEAKRNEITSAGANACSLYLFTEAGWVGIGCANASVADDVHLCRDSFAVVQHSRAVPHASTSVDAFLFTSLLSSAPKIMLNVESGDYGMVERRSCGCRLEEARLGDHVWRIRSFEKLTGAGMTFVGSDVLRIIEEVLPARFGGSSVDYQMVEEEDGNGQTAVSVMVNPSVGEIDEAELIRVVLAELARRDDAHRMMADVWSQAKTLRVKRSRPIASAGGKLLPLHLQNSVRSRSFS